MHGDGAHSIETTFRTWSSGRERSTEDCVFGVGLQERLQPHSGAPLFRMQIQAEARLDQSRRVLKIISMTSSVSEISVFFYVENS